MSERLGTITIMGEEVVVEADVNGRFWLQLEQDDGQGGTKKDPLGNGDTLESAKGKARATLGKRRVEVAVPFRTLDGRQGVAIKRNLRTRGIIVEIAGERDELSDRGYGRKTVLEEHTPDNIIERIAELDTRIKELQHERSTLDDEWSINLSQRVDQEVEKAASERETAGATA